MPVSRAYTDKAKRIALKRRLKLYGRRAFHGFLILLVLGFLVHTLWSWYEGNAESLKDQVEEKMLSLSASAGLTLKNVYISGQYNLKTEDIVKAIALKEGEPILSISLPDLKARVQALGWVKEVTIERQLPHTLHVRITERRPVAIWQKEGELQLVDIDGNIITKGVSGQRENFANLPILVGEDAYQYAGMLFGFLLKDRPLFDQVSAIIRVGGRRWNVRLKNNIEIKLPEKQPDAAWAYLIKLNNEKGLLKKDIHVVDLRLKDRVFIR
jgi:cell division protein FtsQ